jgi:cell wall-associated NlpC family hydrolase
VGLAGVVCLVVVPFLAPAAYASPIDDKRAQAAAIQDQIDANGAQISALSEAYDGAQLRLQQAEQAVADAEAKIAAARAEIQRVRGLVHERAAVVYEEAAAGRSLQSFDVHNGQELNTRNQYADAQAQRDNKLLRRLDDARARLVQQRAAAEQARADAEAERAKIDSARQALEAANAQQEQLLAKTAGELAQLVAQEQARRESAASAQARARFGGGSSGSGDSGSFPDTPPPSARAATAIAFALAQLGKPYLYAAAGPDAYDCSGLTMAAWRAAGVYLPHYSGAQYAMLPKVPLDQMQPGDLVFWGLGGSEHVGLYIGDGMMIHAPHTGDFVRVAAVYGYPTGAARPG